MGLKMPPLEIRERKRQCMGLKAYAWIGSFVQYMLEVGWEVHSKSCLCFSITSESGGISCLITGMAILSQEFCEH